MRFFLKNLALPLMIDFWEKTIQSGFPAQSCFTRSGVRTICDLEEAVPSLIYSYLFTTHDFLHSVLNILTAKVCF